MMALGKYQIVEHFLYHRYQDVSSITPMVIFNTISAHRFEKEILDEQPCPKPQPGNQPEDRHTWRIG
jgi:hypothetical protein